MRTLLIWCILLQVAWAIPYGQVANPRLQGNGSVTDLVGLLSASQKQDINNQINSLEKTNGTEIAVVLVPDCSGLNPRDYSHRLLNLWGVGKRRINNGLLYLVVINERRMEVATGDGIRHYLSDADLKGMLDSMVVPHFKAKHPDQGVVALVTALCSRLSPCTYQALPPLSKLVQAVADPRRHGSLIADPNKMLSGPARSLAQAGLEKLIQQRDLQVVAVLLASPGSTPTDQIVKDFQAAWGCSGREGLLLISGKPAQVRLLLGEAAAADYPVERCKSFEAQAARLPADQVFGALQKLLDRPEVRPRPAPPVRPAQPQPPAQSSSWFPWLFAPLAGLAGGLHLFLRHRKRFCPNCRGRMTRLSESEDDAYLNEGERQEESLGSVDYDIWLCPDCEVTQKGRYASWFSSYSKCPSCSHRTLSKTSITTRSATESYEGEGRTDSNCRFCNYTDVSYYTISRLSSSSSSDSSSSSSSDSGSSYGGGSSSGGGAGASW